MNSQLDALLGPLICGLAGHVNDQGVLLDPAAARSTPADHYGQLSTALALYAADPEDVRPWRLIDAWMGQPADSLGHWPFNALLLHLIVLLMHQRGDTTNREQVSRALKRCRLQRRYPSNNWTLLAQLCHLLGSAPGPSQAKAADRLVAMLDQWSTEMGGFIDFPYSPQRVAPVATPMAYHHKALFVATVAAWYTGRADLAARVERLLKWVWLTSDGAGDVGGFGRSTHALFGDACLLASLILLGIADDSATPVSSEEGVKFHHAAPPMHDAALPATAEPGEGVTSPSPAWRGRAGEGAGSTSSLEPHPHPNPPPEGEGNNLNLPPHSAQRQEAKSSPLHGTQRGEIEPPPPHGGGGLSRGPGCATSNPTSTPQAQRIEAHAHLPHSPVHQLFSSILTRLQSQHREDGLLWLNPAGPRQGRSGWDQYMFLSVYNAWTAGLLAWARQAVGEGVPRAIFGGLSIEGSPDTLIHDPQAGLLRYASANGVILISTRGQTPQAFSSSEVELRYAGGVPFHLRAGDRLLCPAPARVPVERLLGEPALAGWTPIFLINGDLFGLTDFEVQDVRRAGPELRVRLRGHPCQLLRRPAKGLVRRLLAALDWRFLGGALGRRQALQREFYRPLTARLELHWSPEQCRLTHQLELEHRGSGVLTYLNPGGHAAISDALPSVRQLDIQRGENPPSRVVEFSGLDMDSSIPGAIACATKNLDLQPGRYRQRLLLEW